LTVDRHRHVRIGLPSGGEAASGSLVKDCCPIRSPYHSRKPTPQIQALRSACRPRIVRAGWAC
jgi:hypothetical protein